MADPIVFPSTREEYRALALELIQFLKSRIKDTHARQEWSEQNLDLLRAFSEAKGTVSYPTGKDAPPQEKRTQFLWDFIAYAGGKGVLVAAESEYNRNIGGLEHDFEKLLYVRSPVKLFLCRVHEPGEAETKCGELFDYMQDTCSTFSPGEVFVLYFVWWAGEAMANRDVAYWLQVDGDPPHVGLRKERFVAA